ncbi:C-type mannose receptor 2-like [Sebastes umbrosus]|uniref:C-type mannose receptor 2-like n=1 Tax=Sebastes umbrosus TaxID=72105 RepID=UPI00189EB553|nr:C-type mannose receptor 2-like [Sebastes umbrosus]
MTTRYTTIATTVTTTTATSIPCCSPPSQTTETTTQTTTPTTTPTPTTPQPFPATQASLSSPSQLTETTPPPIITPTTQPFPTTQAPLSSPSQLTETTTPPIITPTTQPFPTTQAPLSSPSQLTETTPPISITQAPLSPSQMACPEGWEVFQGRCYYFVNDGMTWPQAQSNCAMLESMLVSVHSAQEYGFLQQLTKNNGNQEAWLGGFYLQDQWLWMDGSWFYNNSLSGESQDSSNPCLMLNSYEAWSNSQCNAGDYSSICVKNSNVPPSMLCPQGWTGFQGRCYYHNYESLSWPEADVNCAGLGASLVSVHSPDEYFFLYKQTAANGYTASWLGGFYLEDQWMWLDGSWFYQGFFTQMSPDVTYPCLSTYNTDGWSNYECNQNFPSFCVKDAVV